MTGKDIRAVAKIIGVTAVVITALVLRIGDPIWVILVGMLAYAVES